MHQCVPDEDAGSSSTLAGGLTPRMIVPAGSGNGLRSRVGDSVSSSVTSQLPGPEVGT